MDHKLVEKITKLVLERMGLDGKQSQYTMSLSEDEMLEWSSLNVNRYTASKTCEENNQYAVPLTGDEVEDWARCHLVMKEPSAYINKVKFTKYC